MKKASSQLAAKATKAVAYARVSTPEQAERDLSLPAQISSIRRYAQDHGLLLVGEYVERGITATDDNRPEFRRMLQDIFAPSSEVGSIIVTHGSRFMRNATKARVHKEALRKRGIRVVAIQQEVSDDPNGRFAEGVFELIDQLESETNGVRTRAGMAENARQGFFNGSKAPFGFRVEKISTTAGLKNKLLIDPNEADVVREVFRRYLAGSGAKSTARELNQRGLLYRKQHWTRDLVLKVISDSGVIGTYYWGRLDTRGKQIRPQEEWIPIKCEPILDEEVFELAQRLRARRDPGRNAGRLPSSPLLLAGLLRCSRCGDSCQLESSGKCDPQGQPYRYYNCRRFCRSGKEACAGYRIGCDTLDTAVLNHIAEHVFTEERCREILRDFLEDQGVLRQKTVEQRRLLERERDELGKRLERWYERIETDPELGEVGAERLRELRAKRDEVIRTLAKLKPLHTIPPYLYKTETIQRFQARLREAFLSGDRGTARVYLNHLVDHIVVGEDEITIEARANVAIAMMAAPTSRASGASEGVVLADVVDWRAPQDSNL
ncbi:MAG TPA: recombinase family protein [Polyangiaceae bacterium]|nr:recombinase family protein [Polyangiaceae bacterium]